MHSRCSAANLQNIFFLNLAKWKLPTVQQHCSLPTFLSALSPWQQPFYFLSLWILMTPGSSYKWSLSVFVFLWLLISLSFLSSRFTLVVALSCTVYYRVSCTIVHRGSKCMWEMSPVIPVVLGVIPDAILWIINQSALAICQLTVNV